MNEEQNNTQKNNKNLKVRNCMTHEVIAVKTSTPLREIMRLLKKHNYHTLPVKNKKDQLVGQVTTDDILNIFQPYSSALGQMLKANPLLDYASEPEDMLLIDVSPELGALVVASDIMSTHVPAISPDKTIEQAYTIMKLEKTEKLLVIDKDKKLLGIITLFDIILTLFRKSGVIT